jgi:prepilin-type N-terminal cleavage/methylation domain-containing protein
MKKAHRIFPGRRGFTLLEAMLAVMIFSVGVVALGRCVENCLVADRIKEEDARARRALENAMAAIEAGAVTPSDSSTEELKGMFAGMKLKTTRLPLKEKNEKNQDIFGIFTVTLEVSWTIGAAKQSREISFYNYPRQR